MIRAPRALVALLAVVALAGCAESPGPRPAAQPGVAATAPQGLPLVRGYRSRPDPCRLAGESALTATYLDDAADLVACPTGSLAAITLREDQGGRPVTQIADFTLFTVPRR